MTDLIKDVSVVTTIPENALQNLSDICEEAIAYSVLENISDKTTLTEVDIGIGILYIKLEEDNILYKFIPSIELENKVSETVCGKYSPIIGKVEKRLKNKILNVYKELM